MKSWLLWFLVCGLAQGVVALIAAATAVHSDEYGPRSVGMAVLVMSAVEIFVTAFFVATEWWDEVEREAKKRRLGR